LTDLKIIKNDYSHHGKLSAVKELESNRVSISQFSDVSRE